jgi:hypothetical protein
MSCEPQTAEEYIERVSAQAREQEEEHVATHEQILQDYEETKEGYQQKSQFFSFLLVLLLIAYIAVNHWQDIQKALGSNSL